MTPTSPQTPASSTPEDSAPEDPSSSKQQCARARTAAELPRNIAGEAAAMSMPLCSWVSSLHDVPFVEVPLSTILPGSQLSFHLYAEVNGSLVLYHPALRKVERLTLQTLWSNDRSSAFVPTLQLEQYLAYLDERIPRLLQEPGSLGDPSQRFTDIAAYIVHTFLHDPLSARARSRAQHLVEATVQRLCRPGQGVLQLATSFRTDVNLARHCFHVMVYGLALACAHGGESTRHLLSLGLGLMLHDLGKLHWSDPLLCGDRLLSAAEWEQLRQHPARALRQLEGEPWVDAVIRDVIANHHERLDGSGYPRGIKAEALSLDARIAAIANAFAGATIDRADGNARPTFEVLTEMLSGGTFDPVLLREFVLMLAEERD